MRTQINNFTFLKRYPWKLNFQHKHSSSAWLGCLAAWGATSLSSTPPNFIGGRRISHAPHTARVTSRLACTYQRRHLRLGGFVPSCLTYFIVQPQQSTHWTMRTHTHRQAKRSPFKVTDTQPINLLISWYHDTNQTIRQPFASQLKTLFCKLVLVSAVQVQPLNCRASERIAYCCLSVIKWQVRLQTNGTHSIASSFMALISTNELLAHRAYTYTQPS